ncbi:threonine ammonia-lyase [Acidaminococcus sp. LBK-2]|uniref:threonine ammonia-lyase n=1 Tax=Acidaminococcus sp. LBK-2 TaxID=3456956 RepID=UPI003FA4681C
MLSLEKIFQARNRLAPYVYHTPLLHLHALDPLLGCQVYVKAECMQLTHSFKIRGALNRILQLTPEERARGVVTASSGNHGRGVAYAAKMLGIQATVVIPDHAPAVKIQAVRNLGAEVILCDKPKRFAIAEKLRDEKGLCYIPPFNDYEVMAGQGTIALEILEDLPNPSAVLIPLGGGGLTSGIATAIKGIRPETRVYACEPARIPRFTVSLKEGKPTAVPQLDTIADGVATLCPGDKTLPIVHDKVDQVIDVPEEALLPAMKLLLTEGKVLAEPSSSIGLAAIQSGQLTFRPEDKVVFVLSGGNVDFSLVQKL